MKLCQFPGGYIDVRVVRAFAKTEDIAKDVGVLVDFSARQIAVFTDKNGKITQEVHLLALNDLNVRATRDGVLYIGSQKREFEGHDGRKVPVYPVTFFPFVGQDVAKTDEELHRDDVFIQGILDECVSFIEGKLAEKDAREKEGIKIPKTAVTQKLADLAKKTTAVKKVDTDPAF